jgi:hypothetical protein
MRYRRAKQLPRGARRVGPETQDGVACGLRGPKLLTASGSPRRLYASRVPTGRCARRAALSGWGETRHTTRTLRTAARSPMSDPAFQPRASAHVALETTEPTSVGRGFISGLLSAILGIAGLGLVLSLRFPEYLSLADLRPLYASPWLRAAIHVTLVASFLLGSVSAVLRVNKALALTGIARADLRTNLRAGFLERRIDGLRVPGRGPGDVHSRKRAMAVPPRAPAPCDPGVSPLAPQRGQGGRGQKLFSPHAHLGHPVRNLLPAGRMADSLWAQW